MGIGEFQQEYIDYLEEQNSHLRNKLHQMRESLNNSILSKNSKSVYEPVLEETMHLCNSMTEEIDKLFEYFNATLGSLSTVLLKKSQMTQLAKKLNQVLKPTEPIGPDLEVIEANFASFVKRQTEGKSGKKRGTAKVSPMIKGLVISTAPRIHLSRVSQEMTTRSPPVLGSPPPLSPIAEASPRTSPAVHQRHRFFRELQIPLQRLNIDALGQAVNVNNQRSLNANVVKVHKSEAKKESNRNHETNEDNSNDELDTIPEGIEDTNNESIREEEKENLSAKSDKKRDKCNSSAGNISDDDICETLRNGEGTPCCNTSPSDKSTTSSESPKDQADPLEGPSWLLDAANDEEPTISYKYVNIRRKKNRHAFSAPSPNSTLPDVPTIPSQVEPTVQNQTERKTSKLTDSESFCGVNGVELENSDMEITEAVAAYTLLVPEVPESNIEIPETVEKSGSPICDSTSELIPERLSNESERNCVEESIEEEGSCLVDPIEVSRKSKCRQKVNETVERDESSDEDRDEETKGAAEEETTQTTSNEDEKKLTTLKEEPNEESTHDKSSNSNNFTDSNSFGESSESEDEERVENEVEAKSKTPEGRPKRRAAIECMQQKVWIVNSNSDKRNKGKSRINSKKGNGKTTKSSTAADDSNSRSTGTRKRRQISDMREDSDLCEVFLPDTPKSTLRGSVQSCSYEESLVSYLTEEDGRRKRKAAPSCLKEPPINTKLRRN